MEHLKHIMPTLKSGDEPLKYNDKTLHFNLLDFWRWNTSDILSNATRGRLAEFIVATAVNIDIKTVREEWGAYDLLTPDEIKIEVKSAAYLQSWVQHVFSNISFSTKASRAWDLILDKRSTELKLQADVYVFCLLKHQDKRDVDPLNMDQWEFYVMATEELNNYKRSQHSITLRSLKALTDAIPYHEIDLEVKRKNKLNTVAPEGKNTPSP